MIRPPKCQLCEGAIFKRLPYYYELNGSRIYGVRCSSCGLVSVQPLPGKEELAALYDEEYFQGDYHCGHRSSYEEETFDEEHSGILENFIAIRKTGRLLEIGAAGGKFLSRARKRGYDVFGVEISPDACGNMKGLDIPYFCGELADAALPGSSFDIVYLGDVLEHLREPCDTLREINRVLAPGGAVGLSCPTNIALLSSIVGLKLYGLAGRERKSPIPMYHLYEFTPHHLKKLLQKTGFEIIRTETGIIPPWKINLRGSLPEKAFKVALHWPNYFITLLTGRMGDRVRIFAKKR